MSSVNPYFTFQYAQPEGYRFSHDSVFFARWVFENVEITSRSRILDLCAGCGIVGLDLLFHLRQERGIEPYSCDFVEMQSLYASDFQQNLRQIRQSATRVQWIEESFVDFAHNAAYDLIVANPPYFELGTGKLSPNWFKNQCRFFMNGTRAEFMACVRRSLAPTGRAYILMREPADERVVHRVRGTPVVEILKNPT